MLCQLSLPTEQVAAQLTPICGALAISARRRKIMLLGVLAHYAVGRKSRRQPRHAFPHPSHPAQWDSPYVAGVERGDNFSLQQIVKSLRLGRIPGGVVTMLLAVAEGPTHLR